MNHHIKSISIEQPCYQTWDDMTSSANGKFCNNCQKNVIDFSGLSNSEILAKISDSNNLCGKFDNAQLDNFNLYLAEKVKTPSTWQNWRFVALFLGLFSFINTEAKPKPVYEQHEVRNKKHDLLTDTITYYKITGKINDIGGALSGVAVKVDGFDMITVTNSEGKFELTVPSTAKQLIAKHVGYQAKIIPILPEKSRNYNVSLLPNQQNLLGEIVIKGFSTSRPTPLPLKKK